MQCQGLRRKSELAKHTKRVAKTPKDTEGDHPLGPDGTTTEICESGGPKKKLLWENFFNKDKHIMQMFALNRSSERMRL